MKTSWRAVAMGSNAGGDHAQEDRVGYSGQAAWIVDGATGVGAPIGLPGDSDAAWYAAKLSESLARHAASFRDTRKWLTAAIRDVDESASALDIRTLVDFPSAAVALTMINSAGQLEVLTLADCLVIAEFADGSTRVFEDPNAERAELEVKAMLAETEPARHGELLLRRRRSRNTIEGRWVARREEESVSHALVRTVDQLPRRLLLATDGASRLLKLPPYLHNPDLLLDSVERSVDETLALLRSYESQLQEAELPWVDRHDDATFLLLEIPH